MNSIFFGIISGIIFGLFSVLLMLPMKFEDKRIAIIGSFINCFYDWFINISNCSSYVRLDRRP